MFRIIAKSLKTGILTEREPFAARPPFGFPVIDFAKCTACDTCAEACPTGAIQASTVGPDRRRVSLSYGACIQCRECESKCPQHIYISEWMPTVHEVLGEGKPYPPI